MYNQNVEIGVNISVVRFIFYYLFVSCKAEIILFSNYSMAPLYTNSELSS